MKKSVAKAWIKALRSGKYKKTQATLKDENGYCCLGVLCEISKLGAFEEGTYRTLLDQNAGFPPSSVVQWAGLKDRTGKFKNSYKKMDSLSELNDSVAKSFRMIANYIEKNWKDL